MMKYNFDINNRAFNAIKNKTKRVEIRTTKLGENHFDYGILKSGDEIEFKSYDGEIINCVVGDVNHYDSIEELLTLEGTRYTLSSTNDLSLISKFNFFVFKSVINEPDLVKENVCLFVILL